MPIWAAVIGGAINIGIHALSSSSGPSYPSPPPLAKLNVQGDKTFMQDYEAQRMQASIDAWKQRYPLLYQGGQYEIGDIARNQEGFLSDTTSQSLANANLESPKQGNQTKLAVDLGLSPIALAQRTSQAATRQIALNPQWTNQISGGTLATMMANNYQNQNAYTQFLGAANTAQYVAGQQQSMYNTQALTAGLLGTTQIASQLYLNQQNPLNYYSYPGAAWGGQPSSGYGTTGGSYGSPPSSNWGSMWNAGAPPSTYANSMYGGAWSPGFGAQSLPPSPNFAYDSTYNQGTTDLYNMYQPVANSGLDFENYNIDW